MTITTWTYHQENAQVFYWSVLSIVGIVVSLVITVAVEVPIVTKIQTWTPTSIPADWRAIRDRWVKFHFLRTGMAIVSFICFVISLMRS